MRACLCLVNLGDLDSLVPQSLNARTKSHTNTGVDKASLILSLGDLPKAKKTVDLGSKAKSANGSSSIFGLQSIDDLLGNVETESRVSQYESDFESVGAPGSSSSRVVSPAPVVPPLRSILSLTPRSLTPKSSRSRVRLVDDPDVARSRSRSPSPIMTGRSTDVPEEEYDSTTRSATTIKTCTDSSEPSDSETTHAVSDSEVSVSSVRSVHWHSSRSGRRSSEPSPSVSRRSPASSARSPATSRRSSRSSRRDSEASYSDDFTSAAVTADETSLADDSHNRASPTDGDTELATKSRTSTLPPRRRFVNLISTSVRSRAK